MTKITRFELIDGTKRDRVIYLNDIKHLMGYINTVVKDINFELQDNDQTLKVFVEYDFLNTTYCHSCHIRIEPSETYVSEPSQKDYLPIQYHINCYKPVL